MSQAPLSKRGTQRLIRLSQNKQRVVLHGHILEEHAEAIWTKTLSMWGLDGTTEDMRAEIIIALADIIISQGTSVASDLEAQSIVLDGTLLSLQILSSVAQEYTTQDNPIRVFYRSFRKASIPCHAYYILAEPSNTEQRAAAMVKYGCDGALVKYAFDMFLDAARYLDLTPFDLNTGRTLNAGFLQKHDADSRSRGLVAAPQNLSTRRANDQATGSESASRTERVNFSALR